jgi:putative ABC transport system ATP-binding protein
VIFADEPTGNLDTRTTYEMMDLITGMAREREQTLIIVTHDTEISEYADQIIQMRDGLIESIKDTNRGAIAPDENRRGTENEKNEDSNGSADDDAADGTDDNSHSGR